MNSKKIDAKDILLVLGKLKTKTAGKLEFTGTDLKKGKVVAMFEPKEIKSYDDFQSPTEPSRNTRQLEPFNGWGDFYAEPLAVEVDKALGRAFGRDALDVEIDKHGVVRVKGTRKAKIIDLEDESADSKVDFEHTVTEVLRLSGVTESSNKRRCDAVAARSTVHTALKTYGLQSIEVPEDVLKDYLMLVVVKSVEGAVERVLDGLGADRLPSIVSDLGGFYKFQDTTIIVQTDPAGYVVSTVTLKFK